jgi:hypothetical protein
LDLSSGPIGAWLSPPLAELQLPIRWPATSTTRFARLAVIESPSPDAYATGLEPWAVFNQLFSLLAILPLQHIHCPVVATPLLAAGNQKVAPERLFPALLENCRSGFRHVPDLERMIVFDRQQAPLEQLAAQIDQELGRFPGERQQLDLSAATVVVNHLVGVLRGFCRVHPTVTVADDIDELLHLLSAGPVTAMALGMHSRRLVERLVCQRLGWRRSTLYRGLQTLARSEVDPWVLSSMHQVRVFGNWMGHPSRPGQRRAVTPADAIAMLAALLRVLEDYPW